MALPLHIFEPRYRRLVEDCLAGDRQFGVALIQSGVEVGGPAVPYPVGTSARITAVDRLPDGRFNIETVGQERFRLTQLHAGPDYLTGTVEAFPLTAAAEAQARRAAAALTPWLRRYLDLLARAAGTTLERRAIADSPEALAYIAAVIAQIPMAEKQQLLSIPAAADLLRRERVIYRREVSLLRAMLGRQQARGTSTFSPN
jgi:Lon protease-like protein